MTSVHHLVDYGGPYAGSFIPMLTGTGRELIRRGDRMTVWLSAISRDREWVKELADVAEIRWLPAGGPGRASVRATVAALRAGLADEVGPVVLHTHFAAYDIPAAVMGLQRQRTAVFWHEHSRPPGDAVTRLRNTMRYLIFGRAVDRILCVSAEITADLRARLAPRRALLTFPNAIDLTRFGPITPEARHAARHSLGIDESAKVVLHFGWDWHRKGGDLMLAAADALADDPNLIWLTVPGIPERERTPPDNASRIHQVESRNDVRAIYAAADVFLSCSRSEGMPYAMLEALASGLPVVATDLPGHRLALRDLPAGEIVSLDPLEIAAALRRTLSVAEPQRATYAELAHARVAESYSLTDWSRRLVDLYDYSLLRAD